MSSLCPQLGCNRAADFLYEALVPCGGKSDAGRENSRSDGHMPVRGFLSENDRNAEPGAVNGIFLHCIISFGSQSRIQAVLKCLFCPRISAESGPEHSPVLFSDEFAELVRYPSRRAAVNHGFIIHGPAERTEELPELFIHGHPRQKIFRALPGT